MERKILTTFFFSKQNYGVFIIITCKKRALRARISALFITVTFENYERYFFYEILVLIKSKNINVCCFF